MDTLCASGDCGCIGLWGPVSGEPGHLGDWYFENGTGCRYGARHPKVQSQGTQLAAAMTGRSEPDSALISAATAGWRRILSR